MHDEHEFRGDYLLLGELGTKRSLRLPRDTAGFSDFDTGGLFTRRSCIELLPESDAAPDSEFILEDGRPYHLGRAETLTPPAGYADGRFAGLLWRDYIRQRDQRGSTLALLG
ncbi:hypothetical protein Ae168Ps1_1501 [Pseudonocardia sp. Ae168_Ps1]|nr:hypothetical protein Ae168Ps1_1501 [Pseudonocardia sp. Ae168_Ps1]